MTMIISSISGLRAILNEGRFKTDLLVQYISAINTIYPQGKIVIGRDGRPSGKEMEEMIANILKIFNREFILLGIVPTPTVQIMTIDKNATIGISITASHNGIEWNGLKFINERGIFFNKTENERLIEAVKKQKVDEIIAKIDHIEANRCKYITEEAINTHITKAKEIGFAGNKINLDEIRAKGFKVAVDAINSSGSVIIPKLLEDLNCSVTAINCLGTGEFVHPPEPLPENLTELAAKTRESKADLGIAVDPDADRLVLIDENGRQISEEMTIVLAIWSFLENFSKEGHNITAVVNHSTTQLVEVVAEWYDAEVFRSPVGEINVVDKMIATNSAIGGEGSGGVIVKDFHLGRDSIAGIVLILSLLAKTGKKISELIAELPKSAMKKVKLEFTGDFEQLKIDAKKEFSKEICLEEDGLKFIGNNYWVQMRKSNTEPILRIIAESNSDFFTNILIDKVLGVVKHII